LFGAGFDLYSEGDTAACFASFSGGGCVFYECAASMYASSDDAGTITIAGGNIPQGTSFSLAGGMPFYLFQSSTVALVPGQTYSAVATGAVVPAFSVNIVAPPAIALEAPLGGTNGYSVPTTTDLLVAWTGGVSGATMHFETGGGPAGSYVSCSWDATLGQNVVPQAVLAPLQGHSGAYLAYGQMLKETVTNGVYTVKVSAELFTEDHATFQ
jgi:hypothetical protein